MRRAAWLLAALVMAACGQGAPQDRAARTPASTTPSLTAAPTATTTAVPTSLPAATAPSCPEIPVRRQPATDRPRYVLSVDVRPADRIAEGTVEVAFTPEIATDRLVFRLWPNGPRQQAEGASMETGPVEVDGRPAPSVMEQPTQLAVPLSPALRPGQTVTARLPWKLRLPRAVRDRISVDGDAVRLGSFFPIVEWEPGQGWAGDPPTTQFSESSAAPTADFDLRVAAPPGFDILASGVPDGPGRWKAVAMRDVAVAVGHFKTATAIARAPDPITVTVGIHAGLTEPPELYLRRSVEVLEDFGRRFGPYPWPSFTVSVTPTLRSGIEYPTHVLHGPGTSGRMLSHEIGHQWFYGLVGNNQGRDPWLDEGLATWAEVRAENTLEALRARSVPASVTARVAEPMPFWDLRSSLYYVGAYIQGAQALAALGPPELVDCALRVYVAQNAYRLARPADLVAATAAVFPDAAATLSRFGAGP